MTKTLKIENKDKKGRDKRLTFLIDGVDVDSWEGRFGGDRAVETTARALGLTRHELRKLLDQGEGVYELVDKAEAPPPPPPPTPLPVRCRGLNETDAEAKEYPDLESCLADVHIRPAEPVISWDGLIRLCAVDADFHSIPLKGRPSEQTLEQRIISVCPTPSYAWVTHGRGVRLIYKAEGIYEANELAAVGAARLVQLEPLGTVELKSTTRHPLYVREGLKCGPIRRAVQTTDLSSLSGWHEGRFVADTSVVETWLEERGFRIGERYEHERCPIDPGKTSHGTPVCCNREGIYCFGCAGHGVRRGSKAAGWFPYAVLVGDPAPSDVRQLVENLTHWEHARFVLGAHHDLPEPILRGCYGALLKSRWNNDPRIPAVFGAGADVVRFSNRWGTLRGETWQSNRHFDAVIGKLPGCQYVDGGDEKGVPGVDRERVARLLQPVNLDKLGYPHLNPVWGMPIYSKFNEPRYPYEITLQKGPGAPPKYVPREERGFMEKHWGRIQNAFPGINRNALRLLLAAKGFAEGDTTFPPFLFITGPAASAKSTTVVVAASIAGDRVHSIPSIGDDQRLRAAILEAKNAGTYAVFNEAVKSGRGREQIGKAEQMEFALGLTPDSMSHKLYVGPVEMGALPVLVWTDTHIPTQVKQHGQIARRFIHIHLNSRVDWHKSMAETGIGKAEWLRLADREYVEACDAILSEVIDDFFRPCVQTFEQVANQLGFQTFEHSEAAKEMNDELLAFYEAVAATPTEDGWVTIDLNDGGILATKWRSLADPPDYRGSQRCSEVDWGVLLGVPGGVVFHTNGRGAKVRVKFDGVENSKVAPGPELAVGAEMVPELSGLPSFGDVRPKLP